VGGLAGVVLVVLALPWLAAVLLMNLANIVLLKMPLCPPEQIGCQSFFAAPTAFDGNDADLARAATWLRQAVALAPGLPQAQRSLAVVEFALENRPAATRAFAAARRSGSTDPVVRWEFMNQLLEARLAAQSGDWQSAVTNFRLGLISGAERTLPVDEHDFFLAVAGWHRQAAESGRDVPRSAYLTGKYLVRAGAWADGERWLRQALDDTSTQPLVGPDLADAHLYDGMALEHLHAPDDAAAHYQAAIRAAPDRAAGYVRLTQLAQDGGHPSDPAVVAALARLEPQFVVGRQGTDPNSRQPQPADVVAGWRLMGYDLDEEALATGPPIDLLLWWQAPPGARPDGDGWIAAGSRWLRWQHVTNFAPNAGFSWGDGGDGLPLGFSYEFYHAAPGSFATVAADRAGRTSTALELRPDRNRRVGLVATPVPVDPNALYLQAGWKRDPTLRANIGRLCTINPQLDMPAYVAYPQEDDPSTEWVHFAAVTPPVPDQQTTRCSLFLLDYDSDGPAQFNDMVLVRIQPPGSSDSLAH